MKPKVPFWAITGIIIFPAIIIFGPILGFIVQESAAYFFWLIVPSVIFEELLEKCCPFLADSQIANLVFALIFWFIIGSAVGFIFEKLKTPKQ